MHYPEFKYVKIGRHRIFTRRVGCHEGAVNIVLVHGLGVSGRYMMPLAEVLAEYANVYIPDLPGFGKSSKPTAVLNIHELADVLVPWMERVGIEQAVFVGNSLGCQIIVDFAVRHPERIQGAVLIGPTIDPSGRSVSQQLVRAAWDAGREPPSLGIVLLLDYRQCGMRRVWRTLRYAIKDKMEEKLPYMNTPTLVIRRSGDPLVSGEWAETVQRLLPDGHLRTIMGAGHTVHYSDPIPIARMIHDHLTRHEIQGSEKTPHADHISEIG